MLLLRSLALAVLALVLGACQPKAAAPNNAGAVGPVATQAAVANPAMPAAEPPPAAPGEFRIVSVLLGNAVDADRLVIGDRVVFARQDTIHASVLSTGADQGLRLSAKWLAPDGATIADTEQPLAPTAALATTFSIRNASRWPEGQYRLLIGINGRTRQARIFQVR